MWKKPINPDGVAQQWNSILLPVKLFNPDRVGFVLVCNPKVETVDFNLGLYCGIPVGIPFTEWLSAWLSVRRLLW